MYLAAISLVVLLCAAAIMDIRTRRIRNDFVVSGLLLAVIVHFGAFALGAERLAGLPIWSPAAGALVGGLCLLPLYAIRGCAAGDVKLMAVVGAFVGPSQVVFAAIGTLLAGGLLAVVFLCRPGVAARTVQNLQAMAWRLQVRSAQASAQPPLMTTAARLPYAVAIALGTLGAAVFTATLC